MIYYKKSSCKIISLDDNKNQFGSCLHKHLVNDKEEDRKIKFSSKQQPINLIIDNLPLFEVPLTRGSIHLL